MQAAASALQGYRDYVRRHVGSLGVAVAIGAAGASAAYHLYHRVSDALADSLLPGTSSGGAGPSSARQRLQKDADENLANHFQSVQAISDATTLPQMLEELERHLNRAASLDALILRLRQVKGGDEAAVAMKHALWRELAEAGFARTAAAVWLLPLLHLLLRVQLNILGRQLFMESNLLEPRGRPGAWRAHALRGSAAELVRVGKGAQEQFLEYAHYLPERSVLAAVERQKLAAFAALEGTQLTQPISADQMLDALDAMAAEFEEAVRLGGGWAELALPSAEDAARYFASFRRAPPDNSALVPGPQVAIPDEDIVRALVEEVVHVMSGPLFHAALKASVGEVARQVHELLRAEMGDAQLPLAKVVPRVSTVADALLKPDGAIRDSVLSAIAELPEVEHLAASVYSFGPA